MSIVLNKTGQGCAVLGRNDGYTAPSSPVQLVLPLSLGGRFVEPRKSSGLDWVVNRPTTTLSHKVHLSSVLAMSASNIKSKMPHVELGLPGAAGAGVFLSGLAGVGTLPPTCT